jgi:leader peptidase (prepilin peptidase) / N-methyltransferase
VLLSLTVVVVLAELAGGALIPRVAYRLSVPYEDPWRPGCDHCGLAFALGWRGWLHVGSRCSSCGGRNGPRTWIVASCAAIAGAGSAWALGPSPLLAIFAVAILAGTLLSAVDLACMRLPDVVVVPTLLACIAALAAVSIVRGDPHPLVRGLVAAVVLAGVYFILAIVTGGIGLGDVKLALVLGLLLGWLGWPYLIAGILVAHLLQGIVAIVALVRRRAGRTTLIPMGPALLIGAWCAVAVIPAALSLVQ